jgi:RNA ligase
MDEKGTSMNHNFPIINNIDDVLPHIKGRDEFYVAEKDGYTVINYAVELPDTFAIDASNPLTGAMRRECRGLIFNEKGLIASRAFHKFPNIGQWSESRIENVDLSKPHVIMDKLDGSMIRPFYAKGKLLWGTKMGTTEVADKALAFVNRNSNYISFAVWALGNGFTPIFEYTSPDNRIVLEYEFDNLMLLAVRNMVTGDYVNLHS